VVAHGDDGVGPNLGRVTDHEFVRLGSRLLGKLRVNGGVSTENRLQAPPHVADFAAAAHRDAANDAQAAGDLIAVESVACGHPGVNICHQPYSSVKPRPDATGPRYISMYWEVRPVMTGTESTMLPAEL